MLKQVPLAPQRYNREGLKVPFFVVEKNLPSPDIMTVSLIGLHLIYSLFSPVPFLYALQTLVKSLHLKEPDVACMRAENPGGVKTL